MKRLLDFFKSAPQENMGEALRHQSAQFTALVRTEWMAVCHSANFDRISLEFYLKSFLERMRSEVEAQFPALKVATQTKTLNLDELIYTGLESAGTHRSMELLTAFERVIRATK